MCLYSTLQYSSNQFSIITTNINKQTQNKTPKKDDEYDCLWHHRKRQRYFINKCMSTFKQQNKTYVLLTDVDEYITFNTIHNEDDPPLPLDVAPIDIPTLSNWKLHVYNMVDKQTGLAVKDVHVEGTISGLPSNNYTSSSFNGKKIRNGDRITTGSLITTNNIDYIQGVNGVQYGNVIIDEYGSKYYLRNDFAFRDAVQMKQAPPFGVPTLNNTYIKNGMLYGTIYNDNISNKKNGEHVVVKTNWKEYPPSSEGRGSSRMKNTLGGHLMTSSIDRQTYYIQGEYELWPPHLSTYESMNIRRRLPHVGDEGKTILDILENEVERLGNEYAQETIGPCISMPRLLYGSYIDNNDSTTGSGRDDNIIPDGFSTSSFVTLKYRYHAIKEARINKFQKTIIDVSRIRMRTLKNHEAENIHVPLTYYCRKDPTRYSTSYFRVNHYLDSYKAYSYRNDARGSKRQCREVSSIKCGASYHRLLFLNLFFWYSLVSVSLVL